MSDKFSKLRKSLAKKNIQTELNDPTEWISTGSAVLNHKLTGRIDVGIPNRRTTLLWGQSGSGKSYLSSNLSLAAQKKGYQVIYLDSEDSISYDYMHKIGLDTSEEMFLPVRVNTIEEVTSVLADIFEGFDQDDKFMIVVDSLAGLLSEKEMKEFEKGESKGDQGQIAKRLKLMVKNLNQKIADFDAFCVMVTHAYQNQDMFTAGKWICTGGKGMQFFPSFSILLDKATLRGDEQGFRMKFEVSKTRFTAPNQTGELTVPYSSGIDFTDGLDDLLVELGILNKTGGWMSYEKDGETVKFQKSSFKDHVDYLIELQTADVDLEEEEH